MNEPWKVIGTRAGSQPIVSARAVCLGPQFATALFSSSGGVEKILDGDARTSRCVNGWR